MKSNRPILPPPGWSLKYGPLQAMTISIIGPDGSTHAIRSAPRCAITLTNDNTPPSPQINLQRQVVYVVFPKDTDAA